MLFLYKGETFLKPKASILTKASFDIHTGAQPLHQEQHGTLSATPLTVSLFTGDTRQRLHAVTLPPTHGSPASTLHHSMKKGESNQELLLVCPLDALEPLEAFPGFMSQTRNEFQEINDIRQRSGLSETSLTSPSLFLLTVKAILLPQTAALATFAKPSCHPKLGKKKTKGNKCSHVLV